VECLQKYPAFRDATVQGCAANSGVSEQPMSLEETAMGARKRAAAAHAASVAANPGVVAFGIESGLILLGNEYFDICVCSVFDGHTHRLGMSSAFQVPQAIIRQVQEQKIDLSKACKAAGITASANIGEESGLIGLLSQGRIDRQQYSQQAIVTALFASENPSWYPAASVKSAAKVKVEYKWGIIFGVGLVVGCTVASLLRKRT
jgi:inosine/xanthosine triphosphatase